MYVQSMYPRFHPCVFGLPQSILVAQAGRGLCHDRQRHIRSNGRVLASSVGRCKPQTKRNFGKDIQCNLQHVVFVGASPLFPERFDVFQKQTLTTVVNILLPSERAEVSVARLYHYHGVPWNDCTCPCFPVVSHLLSTFPTSTHVHTSKSTQLQLPSPVG